MTLQSALVISLFVIPSAHMIIRRFQDRFDSFALHTGLFFLAGLLASGFAAGLTAWVAIPGLAILAAVSQYVFSRYADLGGTSDHGDQYRA